jgi:hypothetical protein
MADYVPVIQRFPPKGSAEWQRQQVEKQAIQPDTTIEELALGPGRLALAGAKSLAKKLVSSPKGKVPEFRIASEVDDMDSNIRMLRDHDYFPQLSPAQRTEKEIAKNKEALSDAFLESAEAAAQRGAAETGAVAYDKLTNGAYADGKYKKGGAISLKDCKVSTCTPSKKKSNW